MHNKIKIMYIGLSLLIMSFPFWGMTFAKTDSSTENKRLAVIPKVKNENDWNMEYLSELGEYFEDHFACRTKIVNLDSCIQSNIFNVSNIDTVLVGKNGWLYYAATLDDYLGINIMSERKLNNCVHNIKLIQEYVEGQGSIFVLAVPPNKNSLYDDNMPSYYNHSVSKERNLDLIAEEMNREGINYADLLKEFSSINEILYLKRDSHWNNLGALIAYNSIMEKTGLDYKHYDNDRFLRKKNYIGDLNSMIYPDSAEEEWNLYIDNKFNYTMNTDRVEDSWIEAKGEGSGKLLMFRDSFGNTLIPFFANNFKESYYSKGIPYNITDYFNKFSPNLVVIEKVERNIGEFATYPAVIEGPTVYIDKETVNDTFLQNNNDEISFQKAECNIQYYQINGIIDSDVLGEEGVVYIGIRDENGEEVIREASSWSSPESDYGYNLYINKSSLNLDYAYISIYIKNNDKVEKYLERSICIPND